MRKLLTALPSPFGRKICIALDVVGLTREVEIEYVDTRDENGGLRQYNPLGKIPVFIEENDECIFDSRVIVEHLNDLHGGGLLIPNDSTKLQVLKQQALGDGILDAALLNIYETRYRKLEEYSATWLNHQLGKIDRALLYAEEVYAMKSIGTTHIGDIALACALGYLDFRFEGDWRRKFPQLVSWLNFFSEKTPAFSRTSPF